jgi:signal transduction histidine kinase
MRMKLAQKFGLLVTGVIGLALLTSLVAVWSSRQLGKELQATLEQNLPSIQAAAELEISLLEQRGLVKAFILDNGNRSWLAELREPKQNFVYWLNQARTNANSDRERRILDRLEQEFGEYDGKREHVIASYDAGEIDRAKELLLRDVANEFLECFNMCEEFIEANKQFIERRAAESRKQMRWVTGIGAVCVICATCLGGAIFWLLVARVLLPLRRMSAHAREFTGQSVGAGDELAAIGVHLRTLMSDVSDTRSSLEQSRHRLVNAERLAVVGKLAASVAHEIRNPLTAIKMWLFSLHRDLNGDPQTDRKFTLIAEEISRLENIVRNLLDFARPPRLKLTPEPLVRLIAGTLEFLGPRLNQKQIALVWQPPPDLPPALADPEQFRQVLLNLLVNAQEATPVGGCIRVSTGMESDARGSAMIVVRISDTGPGIADEVRTRIFEPFYSTKDDGTGLGLCIAARIMADHGGRLLLESSNESGTTFAVWVPAAGEGRTA